MNLRVIENPDFKKVEHAGFSNAQFKKLDGLYLQAAARRLLSSRSVSVDFDDGVAVYSYHHHEYQPPVFRFIIRHVGPRTVMYELWKADKGRIVKSGLFDRAYQRLEKEIYDLIEEG